MIDRSETAEKLVDALARRMQEVSPGQVIEILCHEPDVEADIAAWCRAAGHGVVDAVVDGGVLQIWIRRKSK